MCHGGRDRTSVRNGHHDAESYDASLRIAAVAARRRESSRRFAQAGADFSGVWQPRYHEDQPDRIPGPELTDYTGLPINDSARQYANSWDPSRLTLPEEQCRVHVSPYIYRGPLNLRIWEEKDPKTQDLIAHQALQQHLRADAHDLDGRPSASRSQRAAHLDGILDRPLRRRHADRARPRTSRRAGCAATACR